MARYYVNNTAQPTSGDHEVHRHDCRYLPDNRTYLGDFIRCQEAVAEARRYYRTADGCYWCCRECHRG